RIVCPLRRLRAAVVGGDPDVQSEAPGQVPWSSRRGGTGSRRLRGFRRQDSLSCCGCAGCDRIRGCLRTMKLTHFALAAVMVLLLLAGYLTIKSDFEGQMAAQRDEA